MYNPVFTNNNKREVNYDSQGAFLTVNALPTVGIS